jgi:hypothetical protein
LIFWFLLLLWCLHSLLVLLFFFFLSLCCLFFFDMQILITPLVSSNSSYELSLSVVKFSGLLVLLQFYYSWNTVKHLLLWMVPLETVKPHQVSKSIWPMV